MNPSPYPATFKSAHVPARIVKILLIVGAAATFLTLLADALSLLFPSPTDDQEIADNPIGAVLILISFLFAVLESMIYLVTVVFFCVWLYRSYKNLRAFNPWSRLDNSPGWAVGSFFVPFVNLVVPYRAVSEVWQKSGPPDEDLLSAPGTPPRFPIWWLFWILSAIASNIAFRLAWNGNVPESTATIVSMGASVLSLVAAVFAYLVVDAIDKKQEATRAKLNLGGFSGPPPPPANLAGYQDPNLLKY